MIQEDDSGEFIIPADGFLIDPMDADESSTRFVIFIWWLYGKENWNYWFFHRYSTEKEITSDDSADVEIIEEPTQQNGFATRTKISQPTVSAIVSALVNSYTFFPSELHYGSSILIYIFIVQPSNIPNSISYTISSNSFKNQTIGSTSSLRNYTHVSHSFTFMTTFVHDFRLCYTKRFNSTLK